MDGRGRWIVQGEASSYIGGGNGVPGDAVRHLDLLPCLPIELCQEPAIAMRPLIVVVLLLVAGCGANTRPSPPFAVSATPVPTTEPAGEATLEPTPEPEARVDPTVVAQGFTADPGTDSASYAVVIENPNATWVPRFVDVSITFLDAEGAELTTEMQSITGILPESETAVAGEAIGAGAATAMEVQISNLNSLPERDAFEPGGAVTTTTKAFRLARCVRRDHDDRPVRLKLRERADQFPHLCRLLRRCGSGRRGCGHHRRPGASRRARPRSRRAPLVSVPDIAETRVFGQIGFGS